VVHGHAPTLAGSACRAMRDAGLPETNPGDPRLLALLDQGATIPELAGIAAEAASKRKGWAWVLHVVQKRRADAAAIALTPAVSEARSVADAAATASFLAEQERHRKAASSPEAQHARDLALERLGKRRRTA
jgi:hypothetical protein